ncbi:MULTISPECIES: barstar family protein [unclassified Psychrobacter]|uniref:barstar family protein n=1 Tax=unclassified Psychrobacter TaxID=196806 RepID=UPI003F44E5F4
MSQAIYYINQNGITLSDSIPEQAIDIPIGKVFDKETLLTSLAEACDFPSYFAHNWDSAWDCLTDSKFAYLALNLAAVENINTEDFNVFKGIIEDAYKDFGKPQLWVTMPTKDKD